MKLFILSLSLHITPLFLHFRYALPNVGGSWVKRVDLDHYLQHLYCCSDTDLHVYDLSGKLLFKFERYVLKTRSLFHLGSTPHGTIHIFTVICFSEFSFIEDQISGNVQISIKLYG